MSLTTLAGLKASVSGWLKRTDMAANIPDFIALGEARIARDSPRLQRQLTFSTLTVNSGDTFATLPADFLEAKIVGYTDMGTELRPSTLLRVMQAQTYPDGNRPSLYSIQGLTLHIGAGAAATYPVRLGYYARITPLVADSDTNWLLTRHPGVYLWSALAEAQPFLLDDSRTQLWEQKYAGELSALIAAERQAEFSGGALSLFTTESQEVV